MYLRETKRRNADGTSVSYLALAQNERDPATGVPRARIIHRFGRADQVDREALARLVRSISRFLDPDQAVAATVSGEVSLLDSRSMGASWLADRLWERLGIGQAIIEAAGGRRLEAQAGRAGDLRDGRQPLVGEAAVQARRLRLGGRARVHRGAGRGVR